MSEPNFPEIPGLSITRRLGMGGTASVYLAEDDNSRPVAVKVLDTSDPRLAGMIGQLAAESELLGRIRHPSIIRIYRYDQHRQWHFLVCEYLGGGDLKARIKKGLTVDEAMEITRKIADALDAAHNAGLIHLDVKPENILFRTNGTPVLVDFGIASGLGEKNQGMSGTPLYMSPEQIAQGAIDRSTDIYSLGATLYEMLTGHPPYPLDSPEAILYAHAHRPVPMLPGALWDLQGLIDRMMAKSPNDRISTGEQLITAIEQYWLLAPPEVEHVAYDKTSYWSQAPVVRVSIAESRDDEFAANDDTSSDVWQQSFEQAKSLLRRGDYANGRAMLELIANQAAGEVAVMAKEMLYLLG